MRETEKESRKIQKRFINKKRKRKKKRKKKRKRMTEKSLTTFQDQNPHCIFVCRSFLSFQHFLKQQKT
jgi:hypothetical protein